MSNTNLHLVEYQDRDPENGHYLVKRLSGGEVISVPSESAIAIIKLQKGQTLVLFQPEDHPHGYLLAPM